jgi:predicted glycosyltransferase
MKIAIYYTHSETLGHSTRVRKISEHLARKGHEVLVLQGGVPQPFLNFQRVKLVNIPHPLYGRERFYAESRKPLDYSLINERIKIIKKHVFDFKPDILFTEYFPFGRLEAPYELFPLLNLIKKHLKKIKIFASIGYPIFGNIMSKKILGFSRIFDKLFIHTPEIEKQYAGRFFPDKKLYNRIFNSLKEKIIFTGYIPERKNKKVVLKKNEIGNVGKRKLVVVSRGGGVLYPKIVSLSIMLAKKMDNHFFFITAGPATTANRWKFFRKIAKGIDNVKLSRYVPNLENLINSGDLSVNMAGYNTSVELLKGRKKSIVVPNISDPEQVYRAKLLNDFLGASVIIYSKFNTRVLMEKINHQMNLRFRPKIDNGWFNGLENLEKNIVG